MRSLLGYSRQGSVNKIQPNPADEVRMDAGKNSLWGKIGISSRQTTVKKVEPNDFNESETSSVYTAAVTPYPDESLTKRSTREDLWDEYFDVEDPRRSIIVDDRHNSDSDLPLNMSNLNKIANKEQLSSSQRSTLVLTTHDSHLLIQGVEFIRTLAEQYSVEDEDRLRELIRRYDSTHLGGELSDSVFSRDKVEAKSIQQQESDAATVMTMTDDLDETCTTASASTKQQHSRRTSSVALTESPRLEESGALRSRSGTATVPSKRRPSVSVHPTALPALTVEARSTSPMDQIPPVLVPLQPPSPSRAASAPAVALDPGRNGAISESLMDAALSIKTMREELRASQRLKSSFVGGAPHGSYTIVRPDGTVVTMKSALPRVSSPAIKLAVSMHVTPYCPGKKLPLRDRPHPHGATLSFVNSGHTLHVLPKTKSGFFQLADGSGFVNKMTRGVEWMQTDAPSPDSL